MLVMFSIYQTHYSPVADPSVLVTVTLKSVDDGLLRTSTGCAGPALSLTLYAGCSNITVKATEVIIMLNKNTWGVKKCGANQKQHCKQAGATKRFDIS